MKTNLTRLAQRPAPIRLGYFIFTLLMLWLPIAIPMYLLVRDANLVSIVTMVALYIEFIFLARLWGKRVYNQTQVFDDFGLQFLPSNRIDLLGGFTVGLTSISILFLLEGWLGWLVWQPASMSSAQLILEAIIIGLATGFAEELFFRGWLLSELERDYKEATALWVNVIIFAVSHFIRPLEAILRTWTQFIGLVLLALTLVWGKRWREGRLGLPIGLHGGLVCGWYIINVGKLIKYTGEVPEWVTGVNNNPLAGVMGLLFLSLLGWQCRVLLEISQNKQILD
jgi:uncharacterized protein